MATPGRKGAFCAKIRPFFSTYTRNPGRYRQETFHHPISRPLDTMGLILKRDSEVQGPKVAKPRSGGVGWKLNSRFWGLRRPFGASIHIRIALIHSATGTPRRKKCMYRGPQPTFWLKLGFPQAEGDLRGPKFFFKIFDQIFHFYHRQSI